MNGNIRYAKSQKPQQRPQMYILRGAVQMQYTPDTSVQNHRKLKALAEIHAA